MKWRVGKSRAFWFFLGIVTSGIIGVLMQECAVRLGYDEIKSGFREQLQVLFTSKNLEIAILRDGEGKPAELQVYSDSPVSHDTFVFYLGPDATVMQFQLHKRYSGSGAGKFDVYHDFNVDGVFDARFGSDVNLRSFREIWIGGNWIPVARVDVRAGMSETEDKAMLIFDAEAGEWVPTNEQMPNSNTRPLSPDLLPGTGDVPFFGKPGSPGTLPGGWPGGGAKAQE